MPSLLHRKLHCVIIITIIPHISRPPIQVCLEFSVRAKIHCSSSPSSPRPSESSGSTLPAMVVACWRLMRAKSFEGNSSGSGVGSRVVVLLPVVLLAGEGEGGGGGGRRVGVVGVLAAAASSPLLSFVLSCPLSSFSSPSSLAAACVNSSSSSSSCS
ncbi:hypothetical protein BKA80DRAFT_269217 [Phyllosticta citrichinensis]